MLDEPSGVHNEVQSWSPGTLRKESRSSPLCRLLDRAIVLLMLAILLTMSWPVGQIVWQQTRPVERTIRPVPAPIESSVPSLPSGEQEF